MKNSINFNEYFRNHPLVPFWVFITLIHLVFLSIQIQKRNIYFYPDSYEYLREAENISNSLTFYAGNINQQFEYDLVSKRPPFYPLFISFVKLFWNSDFAVPVVQLLLSLFTIYIITKILTLLKYSKLYLYLVLIILILTPGHFIFVNSIMSETPFQLLLVLALYSFVLFIKKKSIPSLIIYHIFLVIAMVTKPVLYLFWIPNFVFLIYLSIKYKKSVYAFCSLIPTIFIVLYCSWNYQRTGYFHFSSIRNYNLLRHNTHKFLMNSKGQKYANETIMSIVRNARQKKSYAAQSNYVFNQCKNILLHDAIKYTIFHFKGVIHFFIDPGRFEISHFFGMETKERKGFMYYFSKDGYKGMVKLFFDQQCLIQLTLIFLVLVNLMKLVCFISFFFIDTIQSDIRFLMILIISYLALITGPIGASRFAIPILPLYIIIVICFCDFIIHKRKTGVLLGKLKSVVF